MILGAYSIYDTKAELFHPPFFANTEAVAMRMLASVANDTNTSIGQHPEDYILYRVGQWDDQLGELVGVTPLQHVCQAVSLLPKPTKLDLMQDRSFE